MEQHPPVINLYWKTRKIKTATFPCPSTSPINICKDVAVHDMIPEGISHRSKQHTCIYRTLQVDSHLVISLDIVSFCPVNILYKIIVIVTRKAFAMELNEFYTILVQLGFTRFCHGEKWTFTEDKELDYINSHIARLFLNKAGPSCWFFHCLGIYNVNN